MKARRDAIEAVSQVFRREAIVVNTGFPSQELYETEDRHSQFYMLGSLGLVSSIGMGIALGCRSRVVVIDGDGSLLMNLGSLATVANLAPRNLVWIVIDNGSYGSTGGQHTWTSGRTRLADLARGAGIRDVGELDCNEHLAAELHALKHRPGPVFVVVHAASGGDPPSVIPLEPVHIRTRFMEWLSVDSAGRKPASSPCRRRAGRTRDGMAPRIPLPAR